MILIGPQLVRVPDGRIGTLIARQELQGCIEFGQQRILETYPLNILYYLYFITETAPTSARRRRRKLATS